MAMFGFVPRTRRYTHRTLLNNVVWNSKARRSIVTTVKEPPFDSGIPERPYIVALLQDRPWYGCKQVKKFRQTCLEILPKTYGIACASLNVEQWHNANLLDQLLQDLTSPDLIMHPQIVLLAQGPIASWMAQLHLESHALAGLVLVDPILLATPDKNNSQKEDLLQNYLTLQTRGMQMKEGREDDNDESITREELLSYRELLEKIDKEQEPSKSNQIATPEDSSWWQRPLLLEPGAVPTLVGFTSSDLQQAASQTAQRHSIVGESDHENLFVPGQVPVVDLAITVENKININIATEAFLEGILVPWMEYHIR